MTLVPTKYYKGGGATSTTSAVVVPEDFSRVGLTITNIDDTNTVFLAFGEDAVDEEGTPLLPGVSLTLDGTLFMPFTIHAVASAGTPIVCWSALSQGQADYVTIN
jgi:hypothetical protein